MGDQQRLVALTQLRRELSRITPGCDVENCSNNIASLTVAINRLKEKIGPQAVIEVHRILDQEDTPAITTSQWLGAIGFAFSLAAVYYKHKERKKLFEDLYD